MSTDDIRGSTPILTAKDVLIEVRDEVKYMRSSVDILISQNLDQRVDDLESSRDELRGLSRISIVLASLAALGSLVVAAFAVISPA